MSEENGIEDSVIVTPIGDNVVVYDWSPGNGTRYTISVSKLNTESVVFGCVGSVYDGWLVMCGLTRLAYMLQPSGELSVSYIAEKFKLNFVEDKKYVTQLIAYAICRPMIP